MAFTGTWPVVDGNDITVAMFEDLWDELVNVTGDSTPGDKGLTFTDCMDTWEAIRSLREAIALCAGECGDAVTGALWCGRVSANLIDAELWEDDEGAGTSERLNIFNDTIETDRLIWQNEPDGTEVGSPDYDEPQQCSFGESDPALYHLNELHDIIDAMRWRSVPFITDTGQTRKCQISFGGHSSVSAAQAITDLWTAWTAKADADSSDGLSDDSLIYRQHSTYDLGGASLFYYTLTDRRLNGYLDIPTGADAVKIAIGNWKNYQDISTGRQKVPETWQVALYLSTSQDTSWDAAAMSLAATLDVPDSLMYPDGDDLVVVELTDATWTAGVRNYWHLRIVPQKIESVYFPTAPPAVTLQAIAGGGGGNTGNGQYGQFRFLCSMP